MNTEQYYSSTLSRLQSEIYSLKQSEKYQVLMPLLVELHKLHAGSCPEYARLASFSPPDVNDIHSVPFLAISLFKRIALKSIPEDEIFRVLQSSGTSGHTPSRIFLDRETSARQSKALVSVMQSFIGKKRTPMLIIDCPAVMRDRHLSARVAGIQGMMFFGRQPVFALNDDMSLNIDAVRAFSEKYGGGQVLLFGFTYMVWLYFVKSLQRLSVPISFPEGVLIHSGGWKKLTDQQVDNLTFKRSLEEATGICRVHNFYGMAEQVGSVFVECEHGHLHTPSIAEIIVRDQATLQPLADSQQGLIQVLSALPTSYPGYSILTEDLGRVLGQDDCPCGRAGKYFIVDGRVPKVEVRGCSDTFS